MNLLSLSISVPTASLLIGMTFTPICSTFTTRIFSPCCNSKIFKILGNKERIVHAYSIPSQAIETFQECGKKDNKMAGTAATNLSFIYFLVRMYFAPHEPTLQNNMLVPLVPMFSQTLPLTAMVSQGRVQTSE